jgi:hypothetical protein
MSFSTNPYGRYQPPNSREFIALNDAATINFKPTTRYNLDPNNATDFMADLEKNSKRFCYNGYLTRVATERTEAGDGTVTFSEHKDMIKTYHEITKDVILKTANRTWGDKSWANSADQQIQPLSAARGEVHGANLNADGKTAFLKRWHSKIMAEQLIGMLSDEGQRTIKLNEDKYTWRDDVSGEVIEDGLSVLYFIQQVIRPNVNIDIYKELSRAKALVPSQFGHDIPQFISKLEQKRVYINSKVKNAYLDGAFLVDLLDGCLKTPCQEFKAEIQSMKNKYLRGNSGETRETIVSNIITTYVNMQDDDTWAEGIKKTDQVIALSTQIDSVQTQLESALAKIKKLESNNNIPASGTKPGASENGGKKELYTVEPWRLIYTTPEVCKNGQTFHFCKGDHWSAGVKHNGMYTTHKTEDHDVWRKEMDEKRRIRREGGTRVPTDSTKRPSAGETGGERKKLALSERLQAALVTKAGLSENQFEHIWEEVNKEAYEEN